MIIQRTKFFIILFLIIIIPLLLGKFFWLMHSEKTNGIFAFEGMGYAGDQLRPDYSVIYFRHGKDTVFFNGLGNLHLHPGDMIPVRYQSGNPLDAKVDIFAAIWGDSVVYGGIPLLMLLVIFIHPHVVPRRSKLSLTYKKPFIKIV
jgi:hypothetical protein